MKKLFFVIGVVTLISSSAMASELAQNEPPQVGGQCNDGSGTPEGNGRWVIRERTSNSQQSERADNSYNMGGEAKGEVNAKISTRISASGSLKGTGSYQDSSSNTTTNSNSTKTTYMECDTSNKATDGWK